MNRRTVTLIVRPTTKLAAPSKAPAKPAPKPPTASEKLAAVAKVLGVSASNPAAMRKALETLIVTADAARTAAARSIAAREASRKSARR